jgi:hypothetical protein
MKRAFLFCLILAIAAGAGLSTAPANAQAARSQMMCGKRADLVRQLGEKYGESRRSLGLAGGRGVVELFASEATGSWTILITSPQGVACLMAAGEAFQDDPIQVVGNPA